MCTFVIAPIPSFILFCLTKAVCLNHSSYEDGLYYESESEFAAEEPSRGENKEIVTDHPFLALKKLLSDGSFYYSLDFDVTDRLQNR
jgi:hypothetical protein